MDATVFNLADIRSQRNLATLTGKNYLMPQDWAGLAQQTAVMLHSATLFWAEYVAAMLSCHARIMCSASSPYSKPPKPEAPPSNWL